MKFGTKYLHLRMFSSFFHENQCSERHNLNKGISIILTILSMFSPSLDKIWWREPSYNAVEHT